MKPLWEAFRDGFVGAFVLAGAIVMAIVGVASAFVHNGETPARRQSDSAASRL